MIHFCCAESFLFHVTITGDQQTKNNRTLAISIYVDGFDGMSSIDRYDKPQTSKIPQSGALESSGDNSNNVEFYHPPIHQFRPWYALKNRPWVVEPMPDRSVTPVVSNTLASSNRRRSPDEEGKRLIDPFIDNPESCLRDDLDVMDFAFWDKCDLSDITSPSSSGDDDTNLSSIKGHSGWTLVDAAEKMQACIKELQESHPTEIGFDLESYNKSKYSQLTCLLQITSNAGHDYVIDVLAPGVWDLGTSTFAFWNFGTPRATLRRGFSNLCVSSWSRFGSILCESPNCQGWSLHWRVRCKIAAQRFRDLRSKRIRQ
jgi:hypothetical protein